MIDAWDVVYVEYVRVLTADCVVQHVRPMTVDEVFCRSVLARRLERRSRLTTWVRMLCGRVKPSEKFSLYIALLHSLYEYLVVDNGGYVYTNNLRVLITAWLNVSQRNRDGVRLNRSDDRILLSLRFLRG